ncbi:polysaccharide deacetylase family protein [Filobacillus milosensis]|uniref:Polysaccharide deacetylase family protein n=1 Tax=Filobacillus milosensis TaxID=94137 RepID=A0A4Y8IIA6_9BACI|nr:polysaccharide deacetylase family protein [Filobacillus milosensis]TFB18862.1 polysaccharide deacetylase family protein [Filobacillus milosensis]
MSYTFKLIELIELNNGHAKIRISINQEEKLFWLKLDTLTYKSLNQVYNQLNGSLTRLSFMSKRNPFTDSFSSTLTAVKGYEQRKLDFNCSELYTHKLNQIKEASTFKQIEELSFIELPENMAQAKKAKETNKKEKQGETNKAKGFASFKVDDVVKQTETTSNKKEDVVEQNNSTSLKEDQAEEQVDEDIIFDKEQSESDSYKESPSLNQSPSINELDLIDQDESARWLGSVSFVKVFQKGLMAAAALALVLAFSNEHFFATESETSEFNEDKYLVSSSVNLSEKDVSIGKKAQEEASVQGVQVIQSEKEFPMYEVKQDLFYGLPEGYVALTFDDGPSYFTKEIVDVLSQHGVAGTFFFVGTQIEKYPEYVSYTEDEGQVVGSHSHQHANLNNLTPSLLKNDILESITGLEGLVGKQVELFRPPYGAADSEVVEVLKHQNLKTVMWNRDPRDWEANSKNDIVEYFKNVNPSGGIYILHENQYTLEALPEILDYLESKGLKVVGLQ